MDVFDIFKDYEIQAQYSENTGSFTPEELYQSIKARLLAELDIEPIKMGPVVIGGKLVDKDAG